VRITMTAGTDGQEALEHKGHGLFTLKLLEALEGKADQRLSDQEADGWVTTAELESYVQQQVPQIAKRKGRTQTPQRSRMGRGEMVFENLAHKPAVERGDDGESGPPLWFFTSPANTASGGGAVHPAMNEPLALANGVLALSRQLSIKVETNTVALSPQEVLTQHRAASLRLAHGIVVDEDQIAKTESGVVTGSTALTKGLSAEAISFWPLRRESRSGHTYVLVGLLPETWTPRSPRWEVRASGTPLAEVGSEIRCSADLSARAQAASLVLFARRKAEVKGMLKDYVEFETEESTGDSITGDSMAEDVGKLFSQGDFRNPRTSAIVQVLYKIYAEQSVKDGKDVFDDFTQLALRVKVDRLGGQPYQIKIFNGLVHEPGDPLCEQDRAFASALKELGFDIDRVGVANPWSGRPPPGQFEVTIAPLTAPNSKIVPGNDELRVATLDLVGKPYRTKAGSLVRRDGENSERWERKGKLALNRHGYAEVSYERDGAGRVIDARYTDTKGKPVRVGRTGATEGFARRTNRYDVRGRKLEEAYFGLEGEGVGVGLGGRCARMDWRFEGESLEPSACECTDSKGANSPCVLAPELSEDTESEKADQVPD